MFHRIMNVQFAIICGKTLSVNSKVYYTIKKDKKRNNNEKLPIMKIPEKNRYNHGNSWRSSKSSTIYTKRILAGSYWGD